MSLSIITEATIKPITLDEAKKHLRLPLDQNDDDWLIEMMIAAATDKAESETNRSLINRTLSLRVYATAKIELPKPPLVSISSVKIIDVDDVETTLTTDDYTLDTVPLVPELAITNLSNAKYVVVQYIAGFGAAAANVPQNIRNWMLCRINTMYEYREEFIAGSLSDMPKTFIDGLLDAYRIVSVH